jgi:hypothetical protein
MSGAVKAVKKIGPYIAAGAAMAATGGAATPAFGTTAWWAGPAVGGGLSLGSAISLGGLALQGVGTIQAQKYAGQQSKYQRQQVEARNAADAQRNKYNQLQNKRQRLAAIRQARIQQAAMSGSMGNVLGQGGTSGFVGALGSLGSQASSNIGNVNVAEGYGNEISRLNTMSANYESAANQAGSKSSMWSDMDVLGSTLFTNSDKITNLTNKIFT